MKRSRTAIAILSLTMTFGLAGVAGGQTFSIEEVPTLGGNASDGYDINDSGQATGVARVSSSEYRAFLFGNGVMVDLGTLGGSTSSGNAINASGQVAGISARGLYLGQHAFLYTNGSMLDLSTLAGGESGAEAINDLGDVTGGSSFVVGGVEFHAFLHTNGSMIDIHPPGTDRSIGKTINRKRQVMILGTVGSSNRTYVYQAGTWKDLGTLGGSETYGRAMNASGQVTGRSYLSNGSSHAFLSGKGRMKDLGTLDGGYSEGTAVNSAGQVTGFASKDGYQHAFLYSNSKMLDLGTLGGTSSYGTSMNSAGEVTGSSGTGTGDRAFLYTGGSMLDLNDLIDPTSPLKPYVTLIAGIKITDTGYILAVGENSLTGTRHAYVLKKQVQCNPRGKKPC